jgi:hypothetical protein
MSESTLYLEIIGADGEISNSDRIGDYAPGEEITISAVGVTPGATVTFNLEEIVAGDGINNPLTWIVVDDNNDGSVQFTWTIPDTDYENSWIELTAIDDNLTPNDLSDDKSAQVIFTDSIPSGNRIKLHHVWEIPTTQYVPGLVTGYREGDSASFIVEIEIPEADLDEIAAGEDGTLGTADDGKLDFTIYLDLVADSGANGYAFIDLGNFDDTVTPPIPNSAGGSILVNSNYSYSIAESSGVTTDNSNSVLFTGNGSVTVLQPDDGIDNISILDVAYNGADFSSSTNFQTWTVTYEVDAAGTYYFLYGGVLAKPGDIAPDDTNGDGETDTTTIAEFGAGDAGNFQARIQSQGTGDKTVPFKGSLIIKEPDIVVTKEIDRDGDGKWEDSADAKEYFFTIYLDDGDREPEITLDGDDTITTATLSTDVNGQVRFENVEDGTWWITENQILANSPEIYIFNEIEIVDSGSPSGIFGDNGDIAQVTVAEGTTNDLQDASVIFRNGPRPDVDVTISGYKWEDTNGDGTWDVGENGYNGWTIHIDIDDEGDGTFDRTVSVVTSTVLNDGFYTYSETLDVDAVIRVCEDQTDILSGEWTNTYDGTLTFNADDIPIPAGDFEVTEPLNFGNFKNIDISGFKWEDTDGDGVWDVGEDGYNGWTIYLDNDLDPTNGVIASDVTANDGTNDGAYSFENVTPEDIGDATTLYIYEDQTDINSGEWTQTYPSSPNYYTLDVASGAFIAGDFGDTEEGNFGNFENIDISGFKWEDTDGDGIWDAGELGYNGWTIYLDDDLDPTNGVIASDVTANDGTNDGAYSFENVTPEDIGDATTLYIYEDQTDINSGEWTQTYPSSPNYYTLDVASGAFIAGDFGDTEEGNFGNFENIDISGFKWEDTDGDGIWDAGELGYNGWTIYLDDDLDPTNGVIASDVTANDGTNDGAYSFENVTPEDIGDATTLYIYEDQTDINSGEWTQTYPSSPNYYTLDVASGAFIAGDFGDTEEGNFGNFENIDIFGYKWIDVENLAVWDDGEFGENGWTIVLDSDQDFENGYIRKDTTENDGTYNGAYSFENITATEINGATTLYVYEIIQSGYAQSFGNFSVDVASGLVVEGTYGEAEQGNFGNYELGILARTPGFWCTHLEVWDGSHSNDDKWAQLLRDEKGGSYKDPDGMAALDILDLDEDGIPMYYDSNGNYEYDKGEEGLFLGDTPDANGKFDNDGKLDAGELFVPLAVAQEIICASNKLISSDARIKLMRMALAKQLNIYNGAAGAEDMIRADFDWLTGVLTYKNTGKKSNVISSGDVDQDNNYRVDLKTDYVLGQGFTGTKVSEFDPAWQGPAINNPGIDYGFGGSYQNPDTGKIVQINDYNPGGSDIFKANDLFNNNSNYLGMDATLTQTTQGDWVVLDHGLTLSAI